MLGKFYTGAKTRRKEEKWKKRKRCSKSEIYKERISRQMAASIPAAGGSQIGRRPMISRKRARRSETTLTHE